MRPAAAAALAATAALLLGSCGSAVTGAADHASDVSFRVNGAVGSTVSGTVTYHVEYGPTTAYGSSTAPATRDVGATFRYPIEASVTGLAEGTDYHYRVCAVDADGVGMCGADQVARTGTGHDSVTGSGYVLLDGVNRMVVGSGSIDASSDPNGSDATGRASLIPASSGITFEDSGPVSCLRVEGNRAAIGVLAATFADPDAQIPWLIFIEDNGQPPNHDRWSIRPAASVATCPPPTAGDFTTPPAPIFGTVPLPPNVSVGDFVVHDHPSP